MDPTVYINQPTQVIAVFKNNHCYPAKFYYKNQLITVKEVGLQHPTHSGQKILYIFNVSDGQTDYQLEFNTSSLSWKLVALINV